MTNADVELVFFILKLSMNVERRKHEIRRWSGKRRIKRLMMRELKLLEKQIVKTTELWKDATHNDK